MEEEKRKDIGNKTKQKKVLHTYSTCESMDITIAMVKREGRRTKFRAIRQNNEKRLQKNLKTATTLSDDFLPFSFIPFCVQFSQLKQINMFIF